MERFCVYKYINPITNLIFYIGEGIYPKRPICHWNDFISYEINGRRNKKFNRDVYGNRDKYKEFCNILKENLVPIIKIIKKNMLCNYKIN